MAKRNLYLSNVPVEEALEQYLAALAGRLSPRFESVPVDEALDRVSREAVFARCCSPLFNAAAMDGIAVVAASTAAAREHSPLTLVRGRDFRIVDTGDPISPPYDAVIMAEDAIEVDENTVQILEPAAVWQHIRPIGEDIVTGEMLVPGRRRIRPIDIGVLLSGGVTDLEVYQKPRVAVFPTGNEIIEPGAIPREGSIIESNSRMFQALVCEGGGEAIRFAPVPDDPALLRKVIRDAAASFDMVLVNAGSSAGTEDCTVPVLRDIGEVIVHGVAMKPGKPVILAAAGNTPVIGIPGYPVSAWLAYRCFAAPVLAVLSGRRDAAARTVRAVVSKRLVSSLKYREYVRVKLGRVDDVLTASPLARGAGAAMSLARADGFCVIGQNSEGIEAGTEAEVELCRSPGEIDRALVSVGSHDLILDIIADLMEARGFCFSGTHVGSMGGLMALKRGECHIAPIHLLDEETGAYNISYLRQIFPGEQLTLIKGVGRVQGVMVKKGNPLGLRNIADLPRCRYVNRQRGAGTRLFLDHLLKKEGIAPESISGYDREAATHMAVAAAVESGNADAGMGISSAAAALGLDFIPLGEEEYDFAARPRFLELPQTAAFLDILQSGGFHQRLQALGGYTWQRAGAVVNLG